MARRGSSPVTVLHVDPGKVDTDLAGALAAQNGAFDVVSVASADEAATVLADGSVDCLVTERRLPDGDWRDLLGTFRGHATGGPVLVFTDDDDPEAAERSLGAGADGFLRKRDGMGALAALVAGTVGRWRRDATDEEATADSPAAEADAADDASAKIAALHDVASELSELHDESRIFEVAVETAENVLEFDMCYFGTVSEGHIHPQATNNRMLDEDPVIMSVDEGIAGKTFRTEQTYVADHPSNDPDAKPITEDIVSAISVPLPGIGVFQALSTEVGGFTGTDRELAELLVAHVANAVERVRYESTIREERDRFAALFENVPDPVAYYRFEDGQPVAKSVNAAFEETFGYDSADVTGRSLRRLLVPESERDGDDLLRRIRDGDVLDVEATRQTVSGPRSFLIRNAAIDAGTESQRGYAIYTDVSDLKRRERQLRRQNERLSEFTDIVSHDLRNPLSVARGYLAVAMERHEADDALAETETALGEMERLIEDLLALAREGQVVDDPVPTALSAVADRAWRNVETADATLTCRTEMTLLADPDRLRQLFENLFRNSVEHAASDAAIVVDDLPGGGGFYVADDGPGIEPGVRDRVFESGFSGTDVGTGIGLAIVRSVAEAHGWSVSIDDAAGGGARFEFANVSRMAEPSVEGTD